MASYICKTLSPSRDARLVPHSIIMTESRQNIDTLELIICIPIRKVTKQGNAMTILLLLATSYCFTIQHRAS